MSLSAEWDMAFIRQALRSGYVERQAEDYVPPGQHRGKKPRTFSFTAKMLYEGNGLLVIFMIQCL